AGGRRPVRRARGTGIRRGNGSDADAASRIGRGRSERARLRTSVERRSPPPARGRTVRDGSRVAAPRRPRTQSASRQAEGTLTLRHTDRIVSKVSLVGAPMQGLRRRTSTSWPYEDTPPRAGPAPAPT